MALHLHLQTHLGVTTDLSLATPGSTNFKRPRRCLEESPTKIITNNGNINDPKLELKLGLSLNKEVGLGRESSAQSIESLPSSCVSSDDVAGPGGSMMVVVGCPRCLMYVMIQDDVDNKCPSCKSHVLLDVVHHAAADRAIDGAVAGVTARGGAKRVKKS